MKLKLVAVAVTSMLAAGVVNAAEIYNKDGNKLDLYGKVTGLHYFSDDTSNDGDKTYVRLGFKGETQINDQMSGYGQWEYEFKGNNKASLRGWLFLYQFDWRNKGARHAHIQRTLSMRDEPIQRFPQQFRRLCLPLHAMSEVVRRNCHVSGSRG